MSKLIYLPMSRQQFADERTDEYALVVVFKSMATTPDETIEKVSQLIGELPGVTEIYVSTRQRVTNRILDETSKNQKRRPPDLD